MTATITPYRLCSSVASLSSLSLDRAVIAMLTPYAAKCAPIP
jgi:hypothetical protein